VTDSTPVPARFFDSKDELRAWFHHGPVRWEEFRRRYLAELRTRAALLDDALGGPGRSLGR
jgi:hypothetical protein